MSGLALKRLLVVVISMALGFLTAWLIISVGFDMLPAISSIQNPSGVSIQEYGIQYFLVTAVPIGIIFMIWLDLFMETGILPD